MSMYRSAGCSITISLRTNCPCACLFLSYQFNNQGGLALECLKEYYPSISRHSSIISRLANDLRTLSVS
ncbi:hypothetical protein PanWU01x14_289100 [Parasponia andersonii]|uniref:Uncharacterized protein n=1 Tax=Parasponia andersonii TaxID=3476 RepID=A0A2P5AY57_PARAD|nr:hypothetical protein PanWU01x14_289100 [Parasponia andersonii]